MPIWTPAPFWAIRDFSGGRNDKVDDNLITDNEASDCQNVIANRVGVLTGRKGQAKLNSAVLGGPIQGLHAYYNGATRRIITVANGVPYYWNGAAFQVIALPPADYPTGLHATAPVHFVTTVNYLVAMNGVNKPWKWDGVTASVLANAPADGQFGLVYKEKLCIVPKSEPSTVIWSDSFAPETWPGVNYWDIAKGDGDEITAMALLLGDWTIFKRYSIHTLRGTGIEDFLYDMRVPNMGAVGPRAVVQDGMYLYFVADEGICAYNGATADNISRLKVPVLWTGINQEYIHRAVAGRWNGLLWFALPEGASTYNNLVLVYDPVMQAWWPWRGIAASCFIEYNTGTDLLFYTGGAVDGYVRQQDVGYADDGVAITAYWNGKAFDLGAAESKKKIREAFVLDSPGANDVIPKLSLDYGAWKDLTLDQEEALSRRYRYPSGDEWRYMKPRFEHSTLNQSFEVRGFGLNCKVRKPA